ncbi:hypothetical protein DUNSADRAFT_9167 [Dunaliella salina]|uniref:Uncharacterized protein n=1 Tax=Dunaliella salina TaxID=3046 RepID=A0ABQ7GI76_DUNSA|nr:hypothetical protein DUNSADRAFT_9167 [Dunaliella salina]|eukprot:KAF5834254.1 hypothetical protein DUNSADRAFT_9167 [Dunaliella salina]
MDMLDLHLDPALGASDLLGIGVKRADFEYGYMSRARAGGAPPPQPPPPPPARPTTGRQHQQQQQQQQANSRIYVNPEVYTMIKKAAKELDQFQTALDHELDAHIPASERQKTLQSLGLGNVHKKGGAFSQLQQVDTHPGQPRPAELEIPPDPEIESPQASAGAVNVGFNRPLGDLLSRLDEEEQQRQHKEKEQAAETEEDQGVAGESKGGGSSGIEEDQDREEEEGEEEGSSTSGSEHVQSPTRSLQRSFASQKSNKSNRSATHSAGGGQGSDNADQDWDSSDGSDGMESDDGGLEGRKSGGASIRSKRSSRSLSFFSKHTSSGEDEEEGSSSEASEDEDVPEFSMGKSSTFTSQVVDRRKISQDQESEQSANDEVETEEHRAARLKVSK